MTRVAIEPRLFDWACQRSGLDAQTLNRRFQQLEAWKRGEKQPTFKQLEAFAKATHIAFGDLFLQSPPAEPLPLADFRAHSRLREKPPSGDLLDTIYAQQRRQDWFREHATVERLDPVPWIGSESLTTPPAEAAARVRRWLDFEPDARQKARDWVAATRLLANRIEAAGVLVSMNGIVENNNHRRLDPEEFRGFCIADDRAPMIFVNSADHKASQAFTLCHELAHLLLGQSGLSDEDPGLFAHEERERWCDQVAGEVLVPFAMVEAANGEQAIRRQAHQLAKTLRVSPLITLRRVAERSAKTTGADFRRWYQELQSELPKSKVQGQPNYYNILINRVGPTFARNVVLSTREGNTTYTEAFRLLGASSGRAFHELAHRLGVA